MPVNFLNEAERLRFNSFPADLSANDLIAHFTLDENDLKTIPPTASAVNRFGFALQLVLLRFLGFHLPDLLSVTDKVLEYVSEQINVEAEAIKKYGEREQTRSDHQRQIERHLGYRLATPDDLTLSIGWLTERSLEHDRPMLLLQLLCQHLQNERTVRPGLTILEKLVGTAREKAEQDIYLFLTPLLDDNRLKELDELLKSPQPNRPSELVGLRNSATSNTPKTILAGLNKFGKLQNWNVGGWDLSSLNPNRRKQLAQIGFRSTAQGLSRMPPHKRYPILLSFLYQLYEEVLDELVELFDRMLQKISNRTERKVAEIQQEIARLAGDKIKLLHDLVKILLDSNVSDAELRSTIYRFMPEEKLRVTFDECERINEPIDDNYFKILALRYSYLRQFVPAFLNALPFKGNAETAGLIEAIEILRDLDESGKRKIPDDAPVDFIQGKWWDSIFTDDKADRKFYELCVLFELRSALRAGNIWVEGSRRYAKLDSYLIPSDQWAEARPVVCDLLALPESGETRLLLRQIEVESLYEQFDNFLDKNGRARKIEDKKEELQNNILPFKKKSKKTERPDEINVRLENGKLVITKLAGEERPDSIKLLEELVSERLPEIELTDILIEVDAWTEFSRNFKHPNGQEPRSREALSHCYASILAQACNFGLVQMSRMSGLSYRKMAWHTTWYLREETLKTAFSELVNFHNRQPLARVWGGGTLSSSDGQRFPVSVKTRNAVSLPKYFGYGRGLTYYTWTSDQYSQYGTKVVPTTIRDATYVLDEILDNETELAILEHTTDTAGYTDLVFGLFDLLGLQFSPRLADLADQKLFCIDKKIEYKNIKTLISGKINTGLIVRHWDELLRIAGSLKQGFVTASLLISKLQSFKKQNALTKALQEYGRLNKTIFILKYLQSPEYQRKITVQLNKGEAMHALRNFLFVANERQIRKRDPESQLNQAACLNLVVNAVTVWNTVYMQAALDQLKNEGYEVKDEDIEHLSPARSAHINVYGKYYFNVEEGLRRKGLRELRKPEKELWRNTA